MSIRQKTDRTLGLMRILATIIVLGCPGFRSLRADTHYVSLHGGNEPPYTNGWASAATNIQDAINDAATVDNDTVLVSNGVYQTGVSGTFGARVSTDKAITIQSLNNDPTNTIIDGMNSARGVYTTNAGAKLVGFTVTRAYSTMRGAGMRADKGGIISNCIFIANVAATHGGAIGNDSGSIVSVYNSMITSNTILAGAWGSAASHCNLYNCTISSNNTPNYGGAVWKCNLYNCVLAHNKGGGGFTRSVEGPYYYYNCLIYGNESTTLAGGLQGYFYAYNCTIVGNKGPSTRGGGVSSYDNSVSAASKIYNSIIYANSNDTYSYPNHDGATIAFSNSCTTPAVGTGNITDDPLFVAKGSGGGYGTTLVPGNYRLSANSPCVNKGITFSWMTEPPADVRSKDLDGRKRIYYDTVDMGAYERLNAGAIYGFH